MRVIAGRWNRQWAEIECRRDAFRGEQPRPHGIVGRLRPTRAVEIDLVDPGLREIAKQRPAQHAERDEETNHPDFGIRTITSLLFKKSPISVNGYTTAKLPLQLSMLRLPQPIRYYQPH